MQGYIVKAGREYFTGTAGGGWTPDPRQAKIYVTKVTAKAVADNIKHIDGIKARVYVN